MASPTDPPDWAQDEKDKARLAFERAQAEKTQQTVGSDQVRRSAPGMHLTPSGSVRSGPDRMAHGAAMKKDNDQARKDFLREIAKAAREREDRQKENAKERDRER